MASGLVAAAIVMAIVLWGFFRLRRHLLELWLVVELWRWFSGDSLDGRPVTDAGWFRHGQRPLTATGHAPRWWFRPRWQRALHRTGGTLAPFTVIAALIDAPQVTVAVLAVLAAAGLAHAGWRLVRWARYRKDRRTWLHPLHLAAHPIAGWPRAKRAREWISAEVDRDTGAVKSAQLELPAGWPADSKDKDRLVSMAGAKLGIETPVPEWQLAGPAPLLRLIHSPPPPGHVKMDALLPELEKLRADQLLIGVGKGGNLVIASLASESPHIAISMGTGAGKSNLAGWLLFQLLIRGSIGMVIDAKRRMSYPWILKDEHARFAPLPCVGYAYTTAGMHASLAWMSGELNRRGDVAFAGVDAHGTIHAKVGARLFTIVEELNLAAPRLRDYWRDNRNAAEGDPVRSPAFAGLADAAFAGRYVWQNLVFVGQMLTAEVTGSRDSSVREQARVKLLAGYGPKAWAMQAGPDVPMPPPPTVVGRIQVVNGAAVTAAQVPEMSGVRARELVLASDMALLPEDMPCRPRMPATVAAGRVLDTGPDQGVATVSVAPAPRLVTLQEAINLGVVHPDTTLSSLRMARHRDRGNFPERADLRGRDYVYEAQELADYDQARRT